MSNRERAGPPSGDGGVTLGDVQRTVEQGFSYMKKSMKTMKKIIVTGFADIGEFQKRLGRVKTFARQRQISKVLAYLNEHPSHSVNYAAERVFDSVPGGYPSPGALMNACRRTGVELHRGNAAD
ncbi:MAG: hypothetical protein IJS36_01265 [Kiritimatiellae bacterium]|nr:hypothetical protein [Kiritimatiellia bacterium]